MAVWEPARGVPDHVQGWVHERERHRRAGEYAAADALRDRVAAAGYLIADGPDGPVVQAAPRYRTVAPPQIPDRRGEPDRAGATVLLLLDAPAGEPQPDWVVQDATRCLASVLAHSRDRFDVLILDNGLGGAAGDWAADAARNPGIEAVHLAEPVGFGRARGLQHRMATGRIMVWLDTGVTFDGDVLGRLTSVFEDPSVALAGRWGGNLSGDLDAFAGVEADRPAPRDVHAAWGYLLGIRRELVRGGSLVAPEEFSFYRNADADVCMQAHAAGARVVVVDLPATRHVHRGYSETPAALVARESRRNYGRLLARWRSLMEQLAGGP